MSALTFTEDTSIPLPPAKVFKAFVLDFDTILPKAVPHFVKNVEMVQGDGGAGSIKKLNFADGIEVKHLKQRIDVLDKEKMIFNHTTIDGDPWMENVESISHELKLEATSDGGGCKATTVSKYNPKPGTQLNEQMIKAGREKVQQIYKAVGAYVMANPDACS